MKVYLRVLLLLLSTAVIAAGCDTYEDPNLLNPPPPDSASVRVINLMENETVDASFPGYPVAAALNPFQVTPYERLLILEQTLLLVKRANSPTADTLFNQTLTRGARLEYFVFPRGDTSTQVVRLGMGRQEETDLRSRGERTISFFNAVHPDSVYYVKSGCQSGEVVFPSIGFAQSPSPLTLTTDEISLYLFSASDSTQPIATARIALTDGQTPYLRTYMVIARQGGRIKLLMLRAEKDETLTEAPPETRTTATVELLNGFAGGTTISARMQDASSPFASGVTPLSISPPAQVEACMNPLGDSLLIEPAGSPSFKIPIRLNVGSRTLVVVYNDGAFTRAAILERTLPAVQSDTVRVRGINVAPVLPAASISVGAGAPATVPADSRPFGTLRTGITSGWVALAAGVYPFMLSDASTGTYLDGGLERLDPGYYTVITAEQLGAAVLLIVRDDQPGAVLHRISDRGSRAIFFSMMPDMDATFSVGSQTPRPLPYSYVYSTVVPFNVKSINSNAGLISLDPETGNYLIGATGSESNRTAIAVPAPTEPIEPGKASVRFLNMVPNSPRLTVHLDGSETATETLDFGVPSQPRPFDDRQYSVVIRAEGGDTTTLASSVGVQISKGRRYVLVIGPKRQGSTSSYPYQTLWIQE